MSRLVISTTTPSVMETDYARWIAISGMPAAVNSVSARIADGLSRPEFLYEEPLPDVLTRIELTDVGLDILVAFSAVMPSIPVEGASVDVQFSAQGKADAETPFGREVIAKFVAQLKARGAGNVSC